jgi:hypothetical protein
MQSRFMERYFPNSMYHENLYYEAIMIVERSEEFGYVSKILDEVRNYAASR